MKNLSESAALRARAGQRLLQINEAAALPHFERGACMLARTGRLPSCRQRGKNIAEDVMRAAVNDSIDLELEVSIVAMGYGLRISELAIEVAYYRAVEAAERGADLNEAARWFARRHRTPWPALQARILRDEDELPDDHDEAWGATCERYCERAARDFPKAGDGHQPLLSEPRTY